MKTRSSPKIQKVSPKFQVVIPEAVRNEIGLKAGAQIQVISKGSVIFVIPVQSFEDVGKKFGSFFNENDLHELREKEDRSR
jgi:AbrB family looped-hinge helix DNA binding protein